MVAAGSINVAVRVRPPTSWEAARLPEVVQDNTIHTDAAFSTPASRGVTTQSSLRNIVQIVDDRVLTFDPEEQNTSRAFVERGFLPPGTKRYKDRRFIFDRLFRHDAAQEDVYEGTAKPLLQNVLDGYNTTIFAYGATGCGKMHTISGTDDDPGIIYLTMQDLFRLIEERQEDHIVQVQVSFLEIYNEEIRDLLVEPGTLTPRGGLQIREDNTVKVVGLTELNCYERSSHPIIFLYFFDYFDNQLSSFTIALTIQLAFPPSFPDPHRLRSTRTIMLSVAF
ncbi:P-loop containing nucleoside triphosphate hydrolase protein [Cytidiella melzeri]|nr:P-loop containing nucleoside triphosphate hydrolase protein [Cytidiella melzeri]